MLSAWRGPKRENVECIPASESLLLWSDDAERAFEWSVFGVREIKWRKAIVEDDTVKKKDTILATGACILGLGNGLCVNYIYIVT